MRSAEALRAAGYKVEFISRDDINSSADAYVNGILFEFKSPEGRTIKCIENNLQKGLKQSKNIVIDSRRVKNVTDRSIENYLVERARRKRGIKRLIFINRKARAIDIFSKIR